jgi:hypothetical protein
MDSWCDSTYIKIFTPKYLTLLTFYVTPMRKTEICECCGHKITMYRHSLNKQLADALVELALYVQRHWKWANLQQDLTLTKNQYNNFQKMQYFDLVRRIPSGWMITRKWLQFVRWEIGIFKQVATFGRDIVSDQDPIWYEWEIYTRKVVHIRDLIDTQWKTRDEYQKEKGCQFSLFSNFEYAS